MKKNTKKLLALLLSMAMAFGLLAGCGGDPAPSGSSPSGGNSADPSNDPILNNDETINLTVFSQTANWSGAQTGWGATLLKDMFNIELTIIPDVNGAYQTRMESKNLGDIVVWGSNGDDYANAVNQGLLFDWEDEDLLSSYGTYIQDTFPDALEANKSLNEDGKLYGVASEVTDQKGQHSAFIYDWGIRWDLYQQLGHPEVNNLDDLAEVLGKMKELCPTGDDGKPTYAFSMWPQWDGEMVMYVKSMASAYYGYDGDCIGMGMYDGQTGDYYPSLQKDGPYLDCLKFFNKLYRMGLIDPDSMTQTYDQMMPKMQNGNCLMSIFDYAGSNLYNTPNHINSPDSEDYDEEKPSSFMLPLVPTDAKPIVYGLSTGGNSRIWSIGANSMYPEKCMQLINWLHTPEGAMTIWYGIKGLMWDYDENGGTYFTELGQACTNDASYDLTGVEWTSPYTGKTYTLDGTFNDGQIQANNTTWASYSKNPDSNGECFHKSTWASQLVEPRNDVEADWRSMTGSTSNQAYMETTNFHISPIVSAFSLPEKPAELSLKWDQCKKCIAEGSWKAMYASTEEEYEKLVSEMTSAAEAYGYQDCIDWCKEQAAIRYTMSQE